MVEETAEKMEMTSMDMTEKNIEKLAELFPNCMTEVLDEEKSTQEKKVYKKAVNFDKLKQMLSGVAVEGKEAYEFTWVGKKAAMLKANKPIQKTLLPYKEESVNWESTENLYIEGDNLEVLKLLQKSYFGKIDLIYIDPPYNTGSNLIYKNNYFQSEKEFSEKAGLIDEEGNRLVVNARTNGRFHSDWCSMIYSRLILARNLLSDTGIIVLTIDDSEIQNVTAIMNEVFGEENHLGTIVIKNNPSGRSTVTGVSISHEYALFYGANAEVKLGRLPRNEKQLSRYKELDDLGYYEWVNFRKHGGYKEDAPTMFYPIYIKKDGTSFRIPKMKWNEETGEYNVLDELLNDEFVSLPIDETGRERRWKWGLDRVNKSHDEMAVRLDKDKNPAIYIKSRMKDEGMLPLTVWDDKKYSSTEYGTNLLKDLMGEKYFDYPKSIYAVLDCLRIGHLKKDSIILDFFSGSATTAHSVMQLNAEDGGNRKYIMVQLPQLCDEKSEAYKAGYKNICEIGKERIRRAGKKILEEHPEAADSLDIGFRVLKLDESNMNNVYYTPAETNQETLKAMVNNIKKGRTDLDLLFGCLLDLGLSLTLPITSEEIEGFPVYTYDGGELIASFKDNIPASVFKVIAQRQPKRAVFQDISFTDGSMKNNGKQIFEQMSRETEVKVL